MIEIFRDTTGKVYAVRVWRVVIYTDLRKPVSLRYGGIVCNWKGGRQVARHWRGPISLLRTVRP